MIQPMISGALNFEEHQKRKARQKDFIEQSEEEQGRLLVDDSYTSQGAKFHSTRLSAPGSEGRDDEGGL